MIRLRLLHYETCPSFNITRQAGRTSHNARDVRNALEKDTSELLLSVIEATEVSTCTCEIVYLLPPYSQNGTEPSFCAKYGGLKEYLYSKRLWSKFVFTSVKKLTAIRAKIAKFVCPMSGKRAIVAVGQLQQSHPLANRYTTRLNALTPLSCVTVADYVGILIFFSKLHECKISQFIICTKCICGNKYSILGNKGKT